MSVKFKLILSILVLGLSASAILYAWSPALITYVPIEQQYDFSLEQANIINGILASRNELQWKGLEIASGIIFFNLLISLVLIWWRKRDVSANT